MNKDKTLQRWQAHKKTVHVVICQIIYAQYISCILKWDFGIARKPRSGVHAMAWLGSAILV